MTNHTNGRIAYLDMARAVAVLWIVGYWHLRVYCGIHYTNPYLSFPGDSFMTTVVLGLFMFISGLLIAKYHFDDFKKDSITFYKRRFTRFYLLYALSILLLYYMGYNSHFGRLSLITSMTMTSTFILPQPRTLWFFSMIASFYIFTPFILKKTPKSYYLSFILIYGCSAILMAVLPKGIDTRFFWCFPLYVTGLYIGRKKSILNILTSHWGGAISSVVTAIQIYCIIKTPEHLTFLQYISLPFSIILILYLSKQLSFLPITSITNKIAYCSMCAYLFHREIYITLMDYYEMFGFDYPYWVSAITFLPICLFVCYYIQLAYDKYVIPILSSYISPKHK